MLLASNLLPYPPSLSSELFVWILRIEGFIFFNPDSFLVTFSADILHFYCISAS